jgi:hypothetical protein
MVDQPSPPFEYHKWIEDIKRRDAERTHDNEFAFSQKVNEAVVNSGNIALRTALIINGGAAIAVLAFIGNIIAKADAVLASKALGLTDTLIWFAYGVAAAAIAMAFAYFTNYCIVSCSTAKKRIWPHPHLEETASSKWWSRAGFVFQVLATAGGFLSLCLFVFGMIEVKNAISILH